MIGERSPLETLVAFGVCFLLGGLTTVGAQMWSKMLVNREQKKSREEIDKIIKEHNGAVKA